MGNATFTHTMDRAEDYPPDQASSNEQHWKYPLRTEFKLTEKPIDDVTPLKVAVIGAGLTGITAGVLLPAKVPKINLTILEKNGDVVSGNVNPENQAAY